MNGQDNDAAFCQRQAAVLNDRSREPLHEGLEEGSTYLACYGMYKM